MEKLYKGYGDMPPFGSGPDQQEIHREGNRYIRRLFPRIDFINSCHIVEPNAYENTQIDNSAVPAAEELHIISKQQERVEEKKTAETFEDQQPNERSNEELEGKADAHSNTLSSNLRTEFNGDPAPHAFLFSSRKVSAEQSTALIMRAVFLLVLFLIVLLVYFRYFHSS